MLRPAQAGPEEEALKIVRKETISAQTMIASAIQNISLALDSYL